MFHKFDAERPHKKLFDLSRSFDT